MNAPRSKKTPSKTLEPEREPTDAERAQIEAAKVSHGSRPLPAAVAWTKSGPGLIEAPHSDYGGYLIRLFDTLGARSIDSLSVAVNQLDYMCKGRGGKANESTLSLNAALAMIDAIGPRDELEGAIALQMAGCHTLAMDLLGRACQADRVDYIQLYGGLAVKLQRTFAAQAETLAKLRGGGKQQVEVRHVYVNGNAVIGDVHAGGGGEHGENRNQPHTQALSDIPGAPCPAMRREDTEGDLVPCPGGSRSEAMPDARRDVAGRA